MLKFVLCFLFLPLFSFSQLKGKVIKITDGDTFVLLTGNKEQIKIRLHGIDAPEKKQDYGTVSKNYLSNLVFKKDITIEFKNRDRYGRSIGIAFVEGVNMNEKMLAEGMAWHFKKYDTNSQWSALETKAKEEKKGLWSQSNPVAPWEWRVRKKRHAL